MHKHTWWTRINSEISESSQDSWIEGLYWWRFKVVDPFGVWLLKVHQQPMLGKPVPIMLSVLPIIPSRISHNYYSYFIPMPSPIIPVIFFKFLLSVINKVHILVSSWYLVWLRLILTEMLSIILSEMLLYCCFYIHHLLMFGNISLHSAILVADNSFIMVVNIPLFQHNSWPIILKIMPT